MEPKSVSIPNEIMLATVSDILRDGGTVEMSVKGNSMSPFIRNGRDSVKLKLLSDVQVGDIVLAELMPGHYVVHRIHSIDDRKLTLKGDGNLDATESCTRDDVRGTVIGIVKPGRRGFDCTSDSFKRMSRLWVNAPRIIRRCCLSVYVRIKIL